MYIIQRKKNKKNIGLSKVTSCTLKNSLIKTSSNRARTTENEEQLREREVQRKLDEVSLINYFKDSENCKLTINLSLLIYVYRTIGHQTEKNVIPVHYNIYNVLMC